LPLFFASVVTERPRACTPPPQIAEHAPQLPQSESTQSTGHSLTVQATVCVNIGCWQLVPPWAPSLVISRLRVLLLAPHVAEHDE
jgi:hypothetical protein